MKLVRAIRAVPDEHHLTWTEFKDNYTQYKAILLTGGVLVVTWSGCTVVVDRHPGLPCDKLDAHLDRVRADVLSAQQRENAANIKAILKKLNLPESPEETTELFMQQLEKAGIDQGAITAIRRLRMEETKKTEDAKRKRPTADDLQRDPSSPHHSDLR